MKINPNYLALSKQFLIDSKNCNREEIEELGATLGSEIFSLELRDYERAIMLAKKFNKIDLAEQYIKDQVFFEKNNYSSLGCVERFVDDLRWDLKRYKQYKTQNLIRELIEKEFPEFKEFESVCIFVRSVRQIPYQKLDIQKNGESVGIQKQDLLDLLGTI